jgi:hypothetical protein
MHSHTVAALSSQDGGSQDRPAVSVSRYKIVNAKEQKFENFGFMPGSGGRA